MKPDEKAMDRTLDQVLEELLPELGDEGKAFLITAKSPYFGRRAFVLDALRDAVRKFFAGSAGVNDEARPAVEEISKGDARPLVTEGRRKAFSFLHHVQAWLKNVNERDLSAARTEIRLPQYLIPVGTRTADVVGAAMVAVYVTRLDALKDDEIKKLPLATYRGKQGDEAVGVIRQFQGVRIREVFENIVRGMSDTPVCQAGPNKTIPLSVADMVKLVRFYAAHGNRPQKSPVFVLLQHHAIAPLKHRPKTAETAGRSRGLVTPFAIHPGSATISGNGELIVLKDAHIRIEEYLKTRYRGAERLVSDLKKHKQKAQTTKEAIDMITEVLKKADLDLL